MENFEHKPFFTTKEAEAIGLSRRMLSYYVKNGTLKRIGKGIYQSSNYKDDQDIKWSGLLMSAKASGNGVICLLSALIYYELSDEFLNEYWIAIPHNHSKINVKNTRVFRMRNMELGVTEIKISGEKVKIFDIERTIIDSFRLLDIETAMRALKTYMSGSKGKPNIKKLNKYSKELRLDISKYLMPFII